MSVAQTTKHHADQVQATVARGSAATSAVVASWRRSSKFHRLDPAECNQPRRLGQAEFDLARQQIEPVVRAAQSNLDRLFLAVGGVGCCVLLADRNGVPVDRRGAASDDETFKAWGLWTATVWSEECEGTNGIGTCLAEQRALTVHRDQHFYARNTLLSCTSAPIYGHEGSLAAALDVSSCRADRMEENLDLLALAETWDNGKPIRETTAADGPLAIDHFRYFAGAIRAQEGSLSEIDHDTVAYHFHEPLGVVGQIIPWNFPLLMACWKLAPALAAGNCVVLKPAEQTPAAIMVWAGLIGDLLPPGVLNIVNGFGLEAGKPLASSPRIAKIAFTGETSTGRLIMQYASQNLIPVTLELGGKSPNIFFQDVMAEDDDFFDKAIEGFVMFAFNQGEVCTCPSRALIHESIFDRFMERALKRVEAIVQGDPLDPATMIGAQASSEQMQKDPVLYRHRPRGGRAGADGRNAQSTAG
jgi:hypothetical protein